VTTLAFVPTIVWAVWLPRLSSIYRRSPENLKTAVRLPIDIMLVLGLPVACGTALIAGPLVSFLYGSGFGPSVPVLMILAITIVPVYVNTSIGYILIASNRQLVWTVVMAAACIVNPLLNLIFIPAFQARENAGAMGAAYALVITELLIMAAGVSILHGLLSRRTAVRLVKAAMATVVMAVGVAASSRLGLIIQVAAGVFTFSVAAMALRIASLAEVEELAPFLGRGVRSVQAIVGRVHQLIVTTPASRD
jgi:O-antigen/teichoic acid export membrane protein